MEDVLYLKQRAREEAYHFLVDSRQRDKLAFPDPATYEVVFDQPFRNVFSLSLLDATVAATEYAVPASRTTLAFVFPGGARTAVSVDPGDYTLDQLLAALNRALQGTGLAAAAATSPPELSNKVVFSCARAFSLDVAGSSMAGVLGFTGPAVPLAARQVVGAASDRAFLGPLPTDEALDLGGPDQGIRQAFVSLATGPVTGAALYLRAGTAPDGAVITATVTDGSGAAVAAGSAVLEDSPRVPLQVAMTSTAWAVLGQSYTLRVACSDAGAGLYVHASNIAVGGGLTGPAGPADPDRLACAEVTVASGGYAVQSTGLVDLSGSRYLIVRCPEVEAHMYRDRAFDSHHAGLGVVKLAGGGVREQTFDFVSLPPRVFHPIGRLGKFTVRLERRDGSLYEANGVDNAFVFVIRYYVAQEQREIPRVQNPQYTPDPVQHLLRNDLRSRYDPPHRP